MIEMKLLMPVALARATPRDIALIMKMERRPGYEPFVGRWSEDQHRDAMADGNYLYWLGSPSEGAPAGFAILRDLDDPHGNIYLKRICVMDAGQGFGRRFLTALTDWVFGQTQTHRFWLEVAEGNARARHVYTTLGFVEEGRAREVYMRPDGTRESNLQMSILKPEWSAPRTP